MAFEPLAEGYPPCQVGVSLSDPGFLMKSIGTVLPALVICHLPLARYDRRFSAHCGLSGSGHREGRHG